MSTTLHKDLTGIDLHVTKLHADTHVVAGTDPLVLAESQVTDLTSNLADLTGDLNGKAPTEHVHVKADITDFPVLIPGTGNGDVVGPVSATPGNMATYADATGKNIQDGGVAEVVANKSTDVPTDAASDTKYPSVKAVKDYADGLVAGLLDYRGGYNASGNAYPTTGGSGTAGAVMKGDMWAISVAGTLGGVAIQVGDAIIAKIDTPAQTVGNWNTLNTNVSYVPEDQANKENTTLDTSTVKYPTNNLVKTLLDAKVASNTISAAGRELINDANAAAQLVTLGTAAYSEGTWTPALYGFTIVGSAPAVAGIYRRIGNLMFFEGVIHAGAGGNTSVAAAFGGASYIQGFPVAPVYMGPATFMTPAINVLGVSTFYTSETMYTPTFSAQTIDIFFTVICAV